MSLREHTKQLLRMCGHAFVRTVHERLDFLEREVRDLSLQVASLAKTQEALLRASIYLIEDAQKRQGVPPERQKPHSEDSIQAGNLEGEAAVLQGRHTSG